MNYQHLVHRDIYLLLDLFFNNDWTLFPVTKLIGFILKQPAILLHVLGCSNTFTLYIAANCALPFGDIATCGKSVPFLLLRDRLLF